MNEQHQIVQVLEYLGRALSEMPDVILDECYWKVMRDIAGTMQILEKHLAELEFSGGCIEILPKN